MQNTTIPQKQASYFEIGTDNNNTIWLDGLGDNLFSYGKDGWKQWTPETTKSKGAYNINYNSTTGETFFCSDAGLTIKKSDTWTKINKDSLTALPSNRVCFAQRDSKNRLWIGTYSGAVMIDENGKAVNFETTDTILKGLTITSMAEDEKGNVYFGLFEFNLKRNPGSRNKNEGIGIYNTNGTWKHLTTENSGIPCNQNNSIAYSKAEKALWISSETCGLSRYDKKKTRGKITTMKTHRFLHLKYFRLI
ncbi:MAG: two-component regulator propeller domain-containing protein [Bacteroidota bacterium]